MSSRVAEKMLKETKMFLEGGGPFIKINKLKNPPDLRNCRCVEEKPKDIDMHTKLVCNGKEKEIALNNFGGLGFNLQKIIINKPAVIVFISTYLMGINNKKFVAKAINEEFDVEKGLMCCLNKASFNPKIDFSGTTNSQYNKLLNEVVKFWDDNKNSSEEYNVVENNKDLIDEEILKATEKIIKRLDDELEMNIEEIINIIGDKK